MYRYTRFAPSPTGYLHRGHVWSALHVWALARHHRIPVHLRIEDHDRSRCREEHVQAIRDDLFWLGFHWQSESRQCERDAHYRLHFDNLYSKNLLYACACSRSDIQRLGFISPEGSGEVVYAGTCRDLGLPMGSGRAVRLRLPEDSSEHWTDLRQGDFTHSVARQCGDPLIVDRLGQWTYQFAVCVDDWLENIDLVVRGEDLLHSTARQLFISRMIGRPRPAHYFHHSLLTDSTGRKLSKRDHDASIHAERLAGTPPEALLGEVCAMGGLCPLGTVLNTKEALDLVSNASKF